MEIKLHLDKDVNENANLYFSKAKKLKAKKPGLLRAIEETKLQINQFNEKKDKYIENKKKEEKIKILKKKNWFDNFRWTYTSTNNLLFVCGKDSTSNEVLVKKHLDENDLVFHTMAPASPYGILKGGKNIASKEEIEECAQFISVFSAQWKKGFGSADAFWVNKDQISKTAQSGEFISKGAFMIRGEKNIIKNIPLQISLGIREELIGDEENEEIKIFTLYSGSENSCRKICNNRFIKIEPGQDNYKKISKDIKKKLKINSIVDLPKYIPNNCKILKK
jgi:predicted ribosome quality control (RQC) complex YloA/Tae2 family protein